MPDPQVIVALDFPAVAQTMQLVQQLDPEKCRVKVGKELFTRGGPDVVRAIIDNGFDVFLDLKYHDIPNTVAAACRAAADLGVWMLNVHATGGKEMLRAAQAAVAAHANSPLLIAVTVLTSMGDEDLPSIGVNASSAQQVLRLAKLVAESGLDGVVASAQESKILRQNMPADFKLVTPGIRLEENKKDDQTRIMTAANALKMGSDYLVIGRPVTQASEPLQVLDAINQEIATLN